MTGVEYNVNSQFSFLFSVSSLEIADIIRFCLLEHSLGLEALRHFRLKNQTRKIDKFQKKLNFIKFSCAKLFQYSPKYILFTKRIEIFWSRDIEIFLSITSGKSF